MDKNWINNYRLGSYTLFACGLINLRYQWGEPDVLARSAMIFVPGAIFLGQHLFPQHLKFLQGAKLKPYLP
jgi:hypothetical protein